MFIGVIFALSLLSALCGYSFWKTRRDRKDGADRQKLKQAEGVLDDIKKANDAVVRLDDGKRERLQKRYNIK